MDYPDHSSRAWSLSTAVAPGTDFDEPAVPRPCDRSGVTESSGTLLLFLLQM